ncbi:MAG: beta-N-acetylhexosaminidase [Thermoleophilia bacterium]|nr:beta-N-acetylhexosaminidase [Thermoleophilia bacterium]
MIAPLIAAALAAVPGPAPADLTARQLAGQRVVTPFAGTTPPGSLLARVRRGEIGGVILFGANVRSVAQTRRMVRRLQAEPRPRGLPPLLVMVDQEGGLVKRLPGPPTRSAAAMGRTGRRALAAGEGRATGRLLRAAGANVNLAPVLDVARPGTTMDRTGRAFGGRPALVTRMGVAFAQGLEATGVAATAKHFPGLGAAPVNTDDAAVRIGVSLATLRRVDEAPFRAAIQRRAVRLVMLSSAVYPALDPVRPATLSPRIARSELRGRLGFGGVTITDALDTPAIAPYGNTARVARRAAGAGADLLLYAGTETTAGQAVDALARAYGSGALPRADFRAAVARVLALRRSIG